MTSRISAGFRLLKWILAANVIFANMSERLAEQLVYFCWNYIIFSRISPLMTSFLLLVTGKSDINIDPIQLSTNDIFIPDHLTAHNFCDIQSKANVILEHHFPFLFVIYGTWLEFNVLKTRKQTHARKCRVETISAWKTSSSINVLHHENMTVPRIWAVFTGHFC